MQSDSGRLWALAREPEGPLAAYLDQFARLLDGQGFKRRGLGRQIRAAARLSHWLQSHQVAAEMVTDEHAQRFLDDSTEQGPVRQGTAAALRRLLVFLRELGVCNATPARNAPTPVQQAIAAYGSYLQNELGLSAKTAVQYCPFAATFLSERFGVGPIDLTRLRGQDVIQFVLQQATRLSLPRAKAATIALRSFFRYVRYCGGTLVDLAGAVPTVANWSMTAIPRAIAPDHLRAVLASSRRDTPVGRRDYAILLLLARLGLRSSEIVSLTLDSIDWEAGSIAVIGKAGHAAVLPLPVEVGEAIAQYLQSGRPTCACRALFLRANAPIRGLGAGPTVGTIVRAAIVRAGITTPSQGAHQFRHALATDMLRQGATLTEIGSILRHQHPKTTGIYAKVDFDALRPLGLRWPGRVA
jgi:site-specific recombinase XerD